MMTTSENEAENTIVEVDETIIDPIEVIYVGHCESLSGRSNLVFEIGKHNEDKTLHIRTSSNSNGGMFSKQWISSSRLHDLILGVNEITAKSIQTAYGNTSINSGGFCLASLKYLGLVEANPENARFHRHVNRTTFEKVVQDRINEAKETNIKSSKRKSKEG